MRTNNQTRKKGIRKNFGHVMIFNNHKIVLNFPKHHEIYGNKTKFRYALLLKGRERIRELLKDYDNNRPELDTEPDNIRAIRAYLEHLDACLSSSRIYT